jgi:hypothetical protein
MTTSARQPITGPVAWYGRELEASGDWVRRLTGDQIAEIDAALAGINRKRVPTLSITREDFPLPALQELFADLRAELEHGRGAVRIAGLPATRYSDEDLRRLFWGIGTHLGVMLNQNARGELIGEVRDESDDMEKSYIDSAPGKVKSSRARARSTGPLRFHTDRCDVIALLCARNSIAGGVSKLASTITIHNEMLRRRPDLLEELFHDFWRSRPEDEDGLHSERFFKLPVFGMVDGYFTSQYSRTYVEQAQEYPEVPRLTPAQVAAMDLLAEIAEEVCLHAPFEAGDMQFLNNHVIYHGRTAYEDDKSSGRTRCLMRLWLSVPNNRPLPKGHEVLWGSIAPNTVRGGVQVVRSTPAAA